METGRSGAGAIGVRLGVAVAMTAAMAAGLLPGTVLPRAVARTTSRRCDLNGDGFADAAVAALYEDVDGQVDAGAVNIVYGSPAGLQAADPAAQLLTENTPGMPDQAVAGDQFGWTEACGDFNGDGYSDLAIGVPHKDVGAYPDAGQVDVLFGSASGLTTTGVEVWNESVTGVPGAIGQDNNVGRSLAAGDFNADGYLDLAIDIRGEDVNGNVDAGGVDVLYGGSGGLQTTSPAAQLWTEDSPGMKTTSAKNDWFGRQLTAADFNGDGIDDLGAGVFLKDIGTMKDAGAVSVIYGTHHGLDTGAPRAAQFWTQDFPGVHDQSETGDYFGHTLAAADFNEDGYADLAVGVRLEDVNGITDCGAVEVLYGGPKGLRADPSGTTPDDQFWYQGKHGMQDRNRQGDEFSFTLSAGDFNADGVADLVATSPFKDLVPGAVDAGQVAVLYGVPLSGLQAASPDDQVWNENSPGLGQPTPSDQMGLGGVADDFNGDGVTDLAVGVPKKAVGNQASAGEVIALYGVRGVGLQTTAPAAQVFTQDSLGVPQGSQTGDQFGWWVS